jgi:N6-L-threonylcarbamoyladenine synthase
MLSNITATQHIHEQYGGVVPEVASRAHQVSIVPVVDAALKKAGIDSKDLSAIAFTKGPGLLGSLLVGLSFAKGMALALDIPMIEVNHIQAHVLAHFIEEPRPTCPFLCLTVSGGHTQIVLVRSPLEMEIIGTTIDDAAGEAFDKSGKLLGLGYPAGPIVDKLAQAGKAIYHFPEPEVGELNFSFSGLKTSIMRFMQQETKNNPNFIQENLPDICASIQDRIVSILLRKLHKAAKLHQINEIAIAGGVSANSGLRQGIADYGQKYHWNTYIPRFEYCTDNAAMIAMVAWFKYEAGLFVGHEVTPSPRYAL